MPASLPAPVGGWNARDALGEMAPNDAVYLTNLWPATTDVVLRSGYSQWATGLGAQVETLMAYSGGATDKLFAVTAGGNLYDVTAGGAVGAAAVSGLSNGRWQYTNMATAGGNFLIAFNGADNGLRFDGTKWVTVPISTGKTITSGSGTGAVCTLNVTGHGLLTGNTITVAGCSDTGYNQTAVSITRVNANSFTYAGTGTGSTTGGTYTVIEGISIDPTNVVGVALFKNRLWLWQVASLTPYYMGTNAVAGTANQFPIQSIAKCGGYIQQIHTWTGDGGYGMDDMLVMATNKGEVIVYNGLDPAIASTWQLTGVWLLGGTIGRRCMSKLGGDVILISQDGVSALSSALKSDRVSPQSALSNKIQFAASQAISSYGANFGWQCLYYPKSNMLFVNVPVSVGAQQQYVMNTITQAWCNFTGWAANCWEIYKDDAYFGGNGVVCKAWDTNADNGANITADGKQAFNYFGSPGVLKRFTMMRPVLSTNGSPGTLAAINIDFDDSAITSTVSFSPSTSGAWDTGLWDTALWGGGNSIQKQWQGVAGVGYCAAPRLKLVSAGYDVHWISTDLVMERGAIL